MNRQFVVKMMQAKQLQYEAFKEIMPEPMAQRIDHLESNLIDIGKEIFMSVVFNNENGNQEDDTECDSNNDSKQNSKDALKCNSKEDTKCISKSSLQSHSITKTRIHKVTIE